MVTRQERKEIVSQQRKGQILQAALKVFSEKGFGVATMPDVAQEAGLAVGTIYIHFLSKRDLLIALIKEYVLRDPFINLLKRAGELSVEDFLSAVIEFRLGFGLEHMDKFMFLLEELQRDPELSKQYADEIIRPSMGFLEDYLKSGIAEGRFRHLKSSVAARAMIGMIIGLIMISRWEGESSPVAQMPRGELVQETVGFILKGIGGNED